MKGRNSLVLRPGRKPEKARNYWVKPAMRPLFPLILRNFFCILRKSPEAREYTIGATANPSSGHARAARRLGIHLYFVHLGSSDWR